MQNAEKYIDSTHRQISMYMHQKNTVSESEAVFSYPTLYSREFGAPIAALSGDRKEPGGEIT